MRVSDDARFYLFWLVCLPVRAVVAYGGFALVKVDDVFYILFSIYTALTSAGFLAFSLICLEQFIGPTYYTVKKNDASLLSYKLPYILIGKLIGASNL